MTTPGAGQKLVVVIADDAGLRHERVELATDSDAGLLIGRGWHCDLIVQDPLVDAEHARLVFDDKGALHIEDLASLNGLSVAGGDLELGELRLGTSTLEFHRAESPVAPTLQPSRWDALRARLGNPLWPLLALALVICLQVYFGSASELKADGLISRMMSGLLVCGAWALFWGVLSKLLRNSMQMAAHLSVICWGLVTGWVIAELAQYLGWQAQSLTVAEFVAVVIRALWVFAIGAVTLSIATQLRARVLLFVAAVPGVLLLLSAYGLPLLQDDAWQWQAPIVDESYPPGWQWSEGDSLAVFLDESDALFERSAERAAERAAELESPTD